MKISKQIVVLLAFVFINEMSRADESIACNLAISNASNVGSIDTQRLIKAGIDEIRQEWSTRIQYFVIDPIRSMYLISRAHLNPQRVSQSIQEVTFEMKVGAGFRKRYHIKGNIWSDKDLSTTVNGKQYTYSLAELNQYFRGHLPGDRAVQAEAILSALYDQESVILWMDALRVELSQSMLRSGLNPDQIDSLTSEFYLDRVLAERGFKNGLSVHRSGRPFYLSQSTKVNLFFSNLQKKRLFVDLVGIGTSHHSRGHLLAMSYLAEKLPFFPDFIEFLGATKDPHGVWFLLFDNLFNPDTPLWNGSWVDVFHPYLNIRD